MNKLKIALCREREQETPIPIPRHVSTPLAICEEITGLDTSRLPEEIIMAVARDGYVIIDESSLIEKILGVELRENAYLKIYVED